MFIVKTIVTALLIVTIAELGKRSSYLGALLAALPLTSVLAMSWLFLDTKDVSKVAQLSTSIFWLVIPTLLFFLLLPLLLRKGLPFWGALLAACLVNGAIFWVYGLMLRKLGIEL